MIFRTLTIVLLCALGCIFSIELHAAQTEVTSFSQVELLGLSVVRTFVASPSFWFLQRSLEISRPVPALAKDSTKEIPTFVPRQSYTRSGVESKYDVARYGLPSGLKILRSLDSTGENVVYREYMDSLEVGTPVYRSLDDYLQERRDLLSKRMWDSLSSVYDLKKALSGEAYDKLLAQATGITIPIPPNPLSTLFGKPEISINVNGDATIRAGWRWDSQNLGAASQFGQSQSSPIFSQDININVSGRIGDKLKLGVDWKTNRPFEFDNRFKIGFDGYDDDIIKRLEVGNVQLPTSSAFISGSQALFGVRGDFQFGPLFLKTIASQRRGERKFLSVNGGSAKQRFVLHAYDYAQNHFLLDSAYKRLYRQYFSSSVPVIPNAGDLLVKEIELYESTGDVKEAAVGGIDGVAFDTLSPIRAKQGVRYPDALKRNTEIRQGQVQRGRFVKYDAQSNKFIINPSTGELVITNMRRDRIYAVAYRTEGATNSADDDLYTGTLGGINDTLVLKLVYAPNMQPGFKTIWSRQLRNSYPINATNVNTNDTKVNVFYLRTGNDSTDILEGTTEKIVTALKVDQVNNGTGAAPPDGIFDIIGSSAQQSTGQSFSFGSNPNQTQQTTGNSPFFNAIRGEITFPFIEPFREGLDTAFARRGNINAAKQYYYGAVYDNQVELARQQTSADRWLIVGETSGQAQGRISLGYNIAPGSVRVRLDGRELRENDDYTVDYYSGVVTLRSAQAQVPNANIGIEYESNDVMNVTTKTLAGVRADIEAYKGRNFRLLLGGTYMNYNTAALIDRVRIGEEPISNSMLGFDAQFSWDAKWLTSALDALPFFDTKEKSTINFKGEWAMQLPTPNKKLSDVASDNSLPVAYIDDFESAQRYISLGLAPSQWTHCSPPEDSIIAIQAEERVDYKAYTRWYQFFIPDVPITDVYPQRQTVQGRSNLSPLRIDFDPYRRGIYNNNPQFLDKLNPLYDSLSTQFPDLGDNKGKMWGGFQRLLSSFNSNFDIDNIDFIEIMMNIEEMDPTTKMYIDLGQISEDIIPNNSLNTEDGTSDDNKVPNGRIDIGEDNGIDQINDAKEKDSTNYPYPLNLESDPARDNYAFNFTNTTNQRAEDFELYNNFEGNSTQAETGQFPDTEILNKNNGQTISLDNSYFSYEVKLDPNNNSQIVGGGNKGWYQYRIPLRGAKSIVGNPLFSNIQYVRVWFKGGKIKARIADWRFAGANWQRFNYAAVENSANIQDNTLKVAFVNREENNGPPDYYTMPPGVNAPRNLANTDFQSDIRLNEQSLSVSVENLNCGDERAATRFFRTFDMFYYKQLKFFVKGVGGFDFVPPDSSNLTLADTNSPQFYVRFGLDTANYYEYRAPLTREWQDVAINLQKLSALKQLRDSLLQFSRMTYPVEGNPLARFAIMGNPILTRVQFFSFGISNPSARCPRSLSTTMWVDELRVLEPDSQFGYAVTSQAEVKFADLGTLTASFTQTDPYFHRLEERFGTRSNTTNYTINAQAAADKFLPKSFKGASIPVSFSRSVQDDKPRFVAQNDINLDEAAQLAYNKEIENGGNTQSANQKAEDVRRRSETHRENTLFSIVGFKFGLPVDAWYVRETINKLVLGFSYAEQYERSQVVSERLRWEWNFSAQYSTTIPNLLNLQPTRFLDSVPLLQAYKDWKINFLPQQFSLSTTINRTRTTEQSWFSQFPSPVVRDFNSQNKFTFNWRVTENGFISPVIDYSVTTSSTLVPLEVTGDGAQRTGAELANQMLLNDGKLVDFGRPNNLSQNVTISLKPRLPDIGGINKYWESNGSYNTAYTWMDPLQTDPAIRDIAKQVRNTSTFRLNNQLRLRTLTNSWFGITTPAPGAKPDTTKTTTFWEDVVDNVRSLFFDYESLQINFNQSNSANNPGVFGGSGFSNLFGRALTGRASENFLGPSAAYQLGLVTNPHSSIRIGSSNKFPFFSFNEEEGLRPANGQMQDNFSQKTTLDMRTSRPLWKGATLDLSWQTDFQWNRNRLTTTDAQGNPSYSNIVISEVYNRSFLTMPDFLLFSVFNNTPQNVIDRFSTSREQLIGNKSYDDLTIDERIKVQEAMTDAFVGGLQAFEAFPGALLRHLPAVNWNFRWEGVEKYWFFGGIAQRVSLEHRYTSNYQENAMFNDNGRTVNTQTVTMQFQPLASLTFTFDEKKLDGTLTGKIAYNTRTNYGLVPASQTLTQEVKKELAISANYVLRGFTFPLFGIDLKNDVEFSLTTSYSDNRRQTFTLKPKDDDKDGQDLDGTTIITIEPRARYSLSNRVTATAFVRYNGNFSTGAQSPGYSTTEAGVEIRLALSGGR